MSLRNGNKLLSVFEELRMALIECDQFKLKELISDDYKGFSLNGTVENKEIIMQTFIPGNIEISRYTVEEVECDVSDNFGIITGKGKIEGSYGEHEFQHEVLFTDIFKFINGGWQYYKSQTTEIKSA